MISYGKNISYNYHFNESKVKNGTPNSQDSMRYKFIPNVSSWYDEFMRQDGAPGIMFILDRFPG
jgi:hypothetical protein